jgi:glyoxylase-like metal-dependent hydrolase (beta-lactamase superfamily II)
MEISENLHAFTWNDPSANNCNSFFIDGSKKILIDPGHYHLFAHVEKELKMLSLGPGDMDLAVITHGHPDHMEGIRILVDSGCPVAVHKVEMDFIRQVAPHYGEALGMTDFEPDLLLQEGDLAVGDVMLEIIHTPGHSPGSICIYWSEKKALFTGDLVFYQGIGRTDLPGGNGENLKQSIKKITNLEVEHLLPGHGSVISDPDLVKANFSEIERVWFQYI